MVQFVKGECDGVFGMEKAFSAETISTPHVGAKTTEI
jgi:hypothetical protein